MKRRERDIEQAIITALRLSGWVVMKIPNEAVYRVRVQGVRRGAPDLVVFGEGGRVVLLEVKSPRGRLSLHQAQTHQLLRDMGHDVRVVRSLADIGDLVPL